MERKGKVVTMSENIKDKRECQLQTRQKECAAIEEKIIHKQQQCEFLEQSVKVYDDILNETTIKLEKQTKEFQEMQANIWLEREKFCDLATTFCTKYDVLAMAAELREKRTVKSINAKDIVDKSDALAEDIDLNPEINSAMQEINMLEQTLKKLEAENQYCDQCLKELFEHEKVYNMEDDEITRLQAALTFSREQTAMMDREYQSLRLREDDFKEDIKVCSDMLLDNRWDPLQINGKDCDLKTDNKQYKFEGITAEELESAVEETTPAKITKTEVKTNQFNTINLSLLKKKSTVLTETSSANQKVKVGRCPITSGPEDFNMSQSKIMPLSKTTQASNDITGSSDPIFLSSSQNDTHFKDKIPAQTDGNRSYGYPYPTGIQTRVVQSRTFVMRKRSK